MKREILFDREEHLGYIYITDIPIGGIDLLRQEVNNYAEESN